MSELSGVLKVSNGNVTGIVDRLVDDGHVVRVPVEGDRRAMIVRLTRKGTRAFRRDRAPPTRAGSTSCSRDRSTTRGRYCAGCSAIGATAEEERMADA